VNAGPPDEPVPDELTRRRRSVVGSAMEKARYIAAVPALGMVLLSFAVVAWGVWTGVSVTADIIGSSEDLDLVADLLKVTDLFLIGIVFLIVGVGFWELFVEDIDLPGWLAITSLSDLKDKLIDTLLLVLGVYFVEQVLSNPDTEELLRLAGAIALVGGVLVLYRVLRSPAG